MVKHEGIVKSLQDTPRDQRSHGGRHAAGRTVVTGFWMCLRVCFSLLREQRFERSIHGSPDYQPPQLYVVNSQQSKVRDIDVPRARFLAEAGYWSCFAALGLAGCKDLHIGELQPTTLEHFCRRSYLVPTGTAVYHESCLSWTHSEVEATADSSLAQSSRAPVFGFQLSKLRSFESVQTPCGSFGQLRTCYSAGAPVKACEREYERLCVCVC